MTKLRLENFSPNAILVFIASLLALLSISGRPVHTRGTHKLTASERAMVCDGLMACRSGMLQRKCLLLLSLWMTCYYPIERTEMAAAKSSQRHLSAHARAHGWRPEKHTSPGRMPRDSLQKGLVSCFPPVRERVWICRVAPDVSLAPSATWRPLAHGSPGRPLPEHRKMSQGVGGRERGGWGGKGCGLSEGHGAQRRPVIAGTPNNSP